MAKKPFKLPFTQHVVHTQEVQEELITITSKNSQDDFAEIIKDLDDFGTDMDFHRSKKQIKPLGEGWWELRVKQGGLYWRILFRKISRKKHPAEYGLIYMFRKKTNKINKKEWDKATKIAKREGWL
ncbi:TPA: type II toxin-antitoxin system RelE/ParE family toxin [Bacillus cereus]